MKIMICGSRIWTDREQIKEALSEFPDCKKVIHGGAKGADMIGGEIAKKMGIPVEVFPADWDRLGRRAGILRTIEMLKTLDPKKDLVLAFQSANTPGTAFTIKQANKLYLHVITYQIRRSFEPPAHLLKITKKKEKE